jgi:CDP-2,3-bis-(O-geranylgeranyl)-sn-glycerol synthase
MTNFIARNIASVAGLCRKTKFPGTIASFVSLVLSLLSYYFFNQTTYVFIFFIFLIIGYWAINKIHKNDGTGDYQWIGIDEVIGMWLANLFLFESTFSLEKAIIFSIISFIIFRIIDITKYLPPLSFINKSENQNASAVILDDIIAGFYTYFVMLIILGVYNLNSLYFIFILLLPAMIANMTPILLRTKYLNIPINEESFGKNKTWRGFIGAIIFGTISYLLLVKLNMIIFPVDLGYLIFIGFLFSFGAIGGDLIKSYLKRKVKIGPGESWLPWDQIDYVLGAITLTYFIYQYKFNQIIFMLILGGAISAIAHRIGYLIKMNTAKQ